MNPARFPLRRSSLGLSLLAFNFLILALIFAHAWTRQQADVPAIERLAKTVKDLQLTDLALCTEARYTRHLSQADRYAAFQDHPAALEHFPTGAIAGPPARLRSRHGQLD